MAPQPPPPGVFVPVPTFFEASHRNDARQPMLDFATQIRHSVHLAECGIAGLVMLGSTGEAIHLSRIERKAVVQNVREGLDAAGYPNYPLIAGVLTNSVDDALSQLCDFQAAGAQWGLVLAPSYFGPVVDQENIVGWFRAVADRTPLPILIYHYPGVSNNINLALDTYTKLAAHPNIVGAKMSHGNVPHHIQVAQDPNIDHNHFALYSGFGGQLFPVVQMGAAGVIDGLAAFFPACVVHLFNLARMAPMDAQTLAEAGQLQYAISAGEEMVGKFGVVGIKEAVYRVLRMGTLEGGRLPLKGKMPEGEWAKWGEVMRRLQETENRLTHKTPNGAGHGYDSINGHDDED